MSFDENKHRSPLRTDAAYYRHSISLHNLEMYKKKNPTIEIQIDDILEEEPKEIKEEVNEEKIKRAPKDETDILREKVEILKRKVLEERQLRIEHMNKVTEMISKCEKLQAAISDKVQLTIDNLSILYRIT